MTVERATGGRNREMGSPARGKLSGGGRLATHQPRATSTPKEMSAVSAMAYSTTLTEE